MRHAPTERGRERERERERERKPSHKKAFARQISSSLSRQLHTSLQFLYYYLVPPVELPYDIVHRLLAEVALVLLRHEHGERFPGLET